MKNTRKVLLLAPIIVVLGVALSGLVFVARRSAPHIQSAVDSRRTSSFEGGISSPPNLPRLTSKAGLIVVGSVIDAPGASMRKSSLDEKSYSYDATLRVDRLLKGSLDQPTVTVKVTDSPGSAPNGKSIAPSVYAIFFLSQESRTLYLLADPNVQALVAAEGAPIPRGDALECVVSEISYVLNSPHSSRLDRLQAISALMTVDSQQANEALRRATISDDANVKLEAEAALLRHNDISVLEQVQDILLKAPRDSSDRAVGHLSFAILLGVKDPNAVTILSHLLGARDANVRYAAAHALRETHAQTAIGPFSTALNDSDQMVRYNAVAGLAEITGDLFHEPSIDLFKREENKYLTYWRERVK